MKITKGSVYFYIALISAIWFAMTSAAWSYLANLFISLPFGILSLIFWQKGRLIDTLRNRYKAIPVLLGIGVIISIIALFLID